MYLAGLQEIFNWYLRVIDMSKEKILRFIKENRELIKAAPVEQKIKLLKLIRESINQPSTETIHPAPQQPQNSDYLEER